MGMTGLNWTPKPGRFLSWFSLFWIIAGAGFVVAGFVIGDLVRATFLTIGGIWVVVGVFLRVLSRKMVGSYQNRERLRATGRPGTARITAMTQTGLTINDQPQIELELEVQPEFGAAYKVTRKEIVPVMSLGRLSTGEALPVKIDPKNEQNIAIEWEVGSAMPGLTGLPGLSGIPGMTATPGPAGSGTHFSVDGPGGSVDLGDMTQQTNIDAFKQRLKSIGQRGEATLTEVTDTGMSVGENKLYVTVMTVTVPGKAPYTSKSPSLVAPKRIPQLVVGAKVPVWVDPTNPEVLLADWDDPAATHQAGS